MTVTEPTSVRAKPDDTSEQVTQVLPGEPVEVLEEKGEWSLVIAPWQPSSLDERGYPGWVRTAALAAGRATEDAPRRVNGSTTGDLVELARKYLGTPYVWGGLTAHGIDCSGLVHRNARDLGVTVPRDARDQEPALEEVALDEVRAGDLYFFARPGERVHHVGIATGPVQPDGSRPMIHASYVANRVVEEPMDEERLATLVTAARLPTG